MLQEARPWIDLAISAGTLLTLAAGVLVFGQAQRDRRRSQARLVSAWMTEREIGGKSWATGAAVRYTPKLHIRNGSDQPVYRVRVYPLRAVGEPAKLQFLPPGSEHTENVAQNLASWRGGPEDSGIILRFADAAGRGWERSDGQLKPVRWWMSKRGLPRRFASLIDWVRGGDEPQAS